MKSVNTKYIVESGKDKKTHYFQARHKGDMIGYLQVIKESGIRIALTLYVEPEYRKRGIMTRLFSEAFNYYNKKKEEYFSTGYRYLDEEEKRFYQSLEDKGFAKIKEVKDDRGTTEQRYAIDFYANIADKLKQ